MIDLHQPDWPLPEGVCAFYSGRRGGVSLPPYDSFNLGDHVGDQPDAVTENRAALLKALPGADRIQWLSQVHGIDIIKAPVEGIPQADASVTAQAGVACAVMTADCLPVLFCDAEGTQVAAAHAGWRGLASGVLLKTLAQFPDPSQVTAYLAPAIGPQAFEVGPDVREVFSEAPEECFRTGAGDRWLCNLFELARWQLRNAGIHAVYGGEVCTFSDPRGYFSFRRDGTTGRQVSLIWIQG